MQAVCELTDELKEGLFCAGLGLYDLVFFDEGYLEEASERVGELLEQGVRIIVVADRFWHDKTFGESASMESLVYPITSQSLLELLGRYFPESIQTRQVKREDYEVAHIYFAEAGFELENAMKYVADDFAQFILLLKRFSSDKERQRLLKEAYTKQDWKNYITYVHALKNSARLIGASALADLAYQHERSAQSEQYEVVDESYQELFAEWDACIACVKVYLEHCVERYTKEKVSMVNAVSEEDFRDNVKQIIQYLNAFQKKEALMLLKQMSAYKTDGERLKRIEQATIALESYDYEGVIQILAGEL